MKVVAIVTARGGSKSIPKKNIIAVNERPLLYYPIAAAQGSICSQVYVDSDCPEILSVSERLGAKTILRPESLGGDTVDHGRVIRAACNTVLESTSCDAFLILLGNTVMIDSGLIDSAIRLLDSSPDATSVCSVWKAADDHPMRAMEIDSRGYLQSHSSVIPQQGATTDRSSYLPAYFYDQGVWLFRSSNLNESPSGPATWNWMGDKTLPLEREWITGRDINGPFDYNFHKYWSFIKQKPSNFQICKAVETQ